MNRKIMIVREGEDGNEQKQIYVSFGQLYEKRTYSKRNRIQIPLDIKVER
jgi:hypothetical protein